MTEGKWYPIFIYSEKNKGAHNTIMHSKQIVITVALPIANVCEFNYIRSNYNDIHYWINLKISLIRTGAGPKLFGLVRFHCTLLCKEITEKNWRFCPVCPHHFAKPPD